MIPILTPEQKEWALLLQQRSLDLEQVNSTVQDILKAVKNNGDVALCDITFKLDGFKAQPHTLRVSPREIQDAYDSVEQDFLAALKQALHNITVFHAKQLQNSWFHPQPDGTVLGQMITPLKRVGIYVPGGKAAYPSSVLMNAIPAVVAGVKQIVMVTPPDANGVINPHTLVAADLAGVTEIYRVGGAQGVAALAYGTATISKVDKIAGPGNIYVTAAKKQVFGQVDIDMLAGPSEVLIVADNSARPEFIAADMLAQAEHDEMASAVLVTPIPDLARAVQKELAVQLQILNRRSVAEKSIQTRGAIVLTETLKQAVALADQYAPEHLELMVHDPWHWLGMVTGAGAVFLGHFTPETVGDYWAGPNHVLPTGGSARFFSPLNVNTFMKKTSIINYSRSALKRDGEKMMTLATTEGLTGHAAAVQYRLDVLAHNQGGQVPPTTSNQPVFGQLPKLK